MSDDRRNPAQPDRRTGPLKRTGGRRWSDPLASNAWTTGQLAFHIGMSSDFVVSEIRAGELTASKFGREWRIAATEVRRYLASKAFPLPDTLAP